MSGLLLSNLALSAGCFVALWFLSLARRDPSFVDAWWGFGIVVLAWATLVRLPGPQGAHAIALTALATLWGVRLGAYLLWRWIKHGPERRYQRLEQAAFAKHTHDFATFSLAWVFLPQWALQFVVALPVMLGAMAPAHSAPFGPLAGLGAGLAVFGVLFEAVADAQLSHFKSLASNSGKLLVKGLWAWSRHPNYFGEICVWWGLWAIAADAGVGAASIASPLLVTFLLVRVSGAPTTEPHLAETKPDYRAYRARTSAFLPWPKQ